MFNPLSASLETCRPQKNEQKFSAIASGTHATRDRTLAFPYLAQLRILLLDEGTIDNIIYSRCGVYIIYEGTKPSALYTVYIHRVN